MKRRRQRERDEAIAREQADARREALLAELRTRQAPEPEQEPPSPTPAEAPPEPDAMAEAPDGSSEGGG